MKEFVATFQKRNRTLSCKDWSQGTRCTSAAGTAREQKKYGGTYITKCKFGFSREATDKVALNNVDDCLKSEAKIYCLPRTSEETRVNDYNPLLLMLWKANMDIQFVSESSLALAHYVTGYVTKAERSNMQELCGRKLVPTRLCIVNLGVLVSTACVCENVDYMRQVTYC